MWPSRARKTSTKLLTMHSSTSLGVSFRWCMGTAGYGVSAGLAAGNEVLLPDAPGHLGKGKCIQSAAHVAALVAIGEPAHKELIERRAGNHPELAEF